MCRFYDEYRDGRRETKSMPYLTALVNFYTKWIITKVAREKLFKSSTIGSAVIMLDVLEQLVSNPMYNVLYDPTFQIRLSPKSEFKNALVWASSDWMEA